MGAPSLGPSPLAEPPPELPVCHRGPSCLMAELFRVRAMSHLAQGRDSPQSPGFPTQSERERRKGHLDVFLLASFHFPLLMLFSLFMAPCLSPKPHQTSLESSSNRNKRDMSSVGGKQKLPTQGPAHPVCSHFALQRHMGFPKADLHWPKCPNCG